MHDAGINGLAVTCPTCFTQFDGGQVLLRRREKSLKSFPVFHIAELVAWALGSDPQNLNFKSHKVPVTLAAT
jgi:heterodisulfide reductase subunit B